MGRTGLTLFVDASALVAIIAGESEKSVLEAKIEKDGDPIWSAMSCWETVSALQNSHGMEVADARDKVEEARDLLNLRLIEIGDAQLQVALDAYQRYGKGRHAARLNFGDCFAYACAKTNNVKLLYKGHDFSRTDLA